MNPQSVRVRVRTVGPTLVVEVDGAIDAATVPAFQSGVDEALGQNPPVLIVDLSEVTFFGSAGLSVLFVAASSGAVEDLRLVSSTVARRPIELTGLDQVLPVFDTLATALTAKRPAS